MSFYDYFRIFFGAQQPTPDASGQEAALALRQKRSEAAKRGAITRKANAAKKARAEAKAKKKAPRKRAKK